MNEDDVEVSTLLGVLYPDNNNQILEMLETDEDIDDV